MIVNKERLKLLSVLLCERKPYSSGNAVFFLVCFIVVLKSPVTCSSMQSLADGVCVDVGLRPVTVVVSDFMLCINSLVAVVMEAVVAAQRGQGAQSDGIGKENLSAGINPHLSQTGTV